MGAVGKSKASLVFELEIVGFFIQAQGTALPVPASIDGDHRVFANQEPTQHIYPLFVVLIGFAPIAPWMAQLHSKQLLLYFWVHHSL